MNKQIYIVIFIIILPVCFCQTVPPTNPNRSESVKEYCSGIDRRTLLSNQTYQQYLDLHNNLLKYFNIQTNQPIQDIFDQKPVSQSQSFDVNSSITIYYIPYVVGFLLTSASILFLLAILFCNYEVISYCNKEAEYSKCQMIWPMLLILIFSFAILGLSGYGLSMSDSIIEPYEKARCAGALFVDDLINGNVTDDNQHYFVGLWVLRSFMPLVTSADFYFNFTKSLVSTVMQQQQNLLLAAQQNTRIIPNKNGSVMELRYNIPLDSDVAEGTIPSTLNNIIGSSAMENTLVSQTIMNIQNLRNNLTNLQNSIQTFQNNVQNAKDYLVNAGAQITTIMKNFTALDKSLQQTFTDEQSYPYGMRGATIAMFSLAITSAVIIILFVIGFEFCFYYKSKYLIGIIFFLLAITALFCYVLAIIYGMIVPVTVSGCQFAKWSLESPENFRLAYSNFLNQTQLERMSRCIPGSDGDIVSQMLGNYAFQSLNAASILIEDISNFTSVRPDQAIKPQFQKIYQFLDNTTSSRYIDIDDLFALKSLKDISNSTNFPNCNSHNFVQDSWVPSLNQTIFQCLNQDNNASSYQLCPIEADFTNSQLNCIGCMDTASFANQYNASTSSQIKTLFESRYGTQSACSTFNTQMSNIWTNYYIQKFNYLQPVKVRYSVANDSIDVSLLLLNSQLYPVINVLLSIIEQSPIDPIGFQQGVNCTVLGEDLVLFTRYTCSSVLKPIYLHSIIVGALSFVLSLSLCCIVCSYTRYHKAVNTQYESFQGIKNEQSFNRPPEQEQVQKEKNDIIKNWKQRKQLKKKLESKANLVEEDDNFDYV